MKELYYKALQKIKSLSKTLSEEEWNVIAKQEKYLMSESIKYISNKDFNELCTEIRK